MFNIGMPELIVIFIIALIIFGPKKLPELGRDIGKMIREFKKASKEVEDTLGINTDTEENNHKEKSVGKEVGKMIGEFKKASKEVEDTLDINTDIEENNHKEKLGS